MVDNHRAAMIELQSEESPRARRLDELVVATGADPLALLAELRAAREAAEPSAEGARRRDLAALELAFLREQAARAGAPPALRAAMERLELAWLDFEARCFAAHDPSSREALFELTDLTARAAVLGQRARAADLAAEVDRRVATVHVDEALQEEAAERYVSLAAEAEELDLPERVRLMQETARVLLALGNRSGNRELRRLGKRLERSADDHRLSLRVERVLTRRGAVALETTSLVLLLLLFVLLGVEAIVPGAAEVHWFRAIDGVVCVFFVAEFLFKLALSPARWSWFLRNAVTDLLPALPATLLLLSVPAVPVGDDAIFLRALRFMRIAYIARYVQALRPVLRLCRLLLFMVRGMDRLVRRFSPFLNRNFVFFESALERATHPEEADRSLDMFTALRREHVLLTEMPVAQRMEALVARAAHLAARLEQAPPLQRQGTAPRVGQRDVPVEHVIETLHAMRPEQLGAWMTRADLNAIDRVVRHLNAPLIRSLPFVRRLRSKTLARTPEERIIDFGKRIADWFEKWRNRILFLADMHGILTGPQILDHLATTMIRTGKRPAIRLLVFGGMFLLVRALLGESSVVGEFLKRFVATPLLVLGAVCLVVLWLGRWLKRLAGEAAESLKRTSEAHFISLLEMQKSRDEEADIAFLTRRVFRRDLKPEQAQWALCRQLEAVRRGAPWDGTGLSEPIREDVNRVALLYLHFLDGGILHETDVKTTEQLLANLSLENIRSDHLGFTARDRKRLRRLSLAEGSAITGPYLWFRCITESVAIETAKRVIEYNRRCLPLHRYARASAEERRGMDDWLAARCADTRGRSLERTSAPNDGAAYVTTEFNALDFLSLDAGREDHIERIFGARVQDTLRVDRRRMIREIFGTRPLDRMPRSKRVVNFYAIYMRRLSRGRILLLPLLWAMLVFRTIVMCIAKIMEMVREITLPERADRKRESGVASFAVARRKIHRMKAPGLLEAMMMRAAFDPAYSGAPTCWSRIAAPEHASELERDMDFLGLPQHAREALRARSAAVCREVERCHLRMRQRPPLGEWASDIERELGETAVTIAWITDRRGMRTLLCAEEWFAAKRFAFEHGAPAPRSHPAACLRWIMRSGEAHPVDEWLRRIAGGPVSKRVRRGFRAAYDRGDAEVRAAVRAWRELPVDVAPRERGLEIARAAFTEHGEVSRELAALRAVQSLSVLDVRNYARLVFHLGDYATDGESPALADALP